MLSTCLHAGRSLLQWTGLQKLLPQAAPSLFPEVNGIVPSPFIVRESELDVSFANLFARDVIDHTGLLKTTIDQTIIPTPTVIAAVSTFLLTPLPGFQGTLIDFMLHDRELAAQRGLTLKQFSIVGSVVPYLMQSMLQELFTERLGKEAAKELLCPVVWQHLTQAPNDWDMRSEIDHKDFAILAEHAKGLAANAAAQYLPAYDKQKKQGYVLLKIGQLDYCLGMFKRAFLFSASNLCFMIDATSLSADAANLQVKISSEGGCGLQALLDRAYRRLRVPDPHTVDYRGAILVASDITRGYLPILHGAYPLLLKTLLAQHIPRLNWPERIAELLQRLVAAHHGTNSLALAAVTLQFELELPRGSLVVPGQAFYPSYEENLLQQLWEKLFTQLPPNQPLITLRVQHKLSSQQLAAVLQVGGLLALGLPTAHQGIYSVALQSSLGKPALRYTVQDQVTLLLSLEPSTLEKWLGEPAILAGALQPELLALLRCCLPSDPTPEDIQTPVLERYASALTCSTMQQPLLNYLERCLASEELFFQLVGTALAVFLAAQGHKIAEHILVYRALPRLLAQPAALQHYGRDIALAWLLRHTAKNQQPVVKELILNFAGTEPTATLAWLQILLSTSHVPYAQGCYQKALLLCHEHSLPIDRRQHVWHLICHSLCCQDNVVVRQIFLLDLLKSAEELATPIALNTLIVLSNAILQQHSVEAYRLLPLWNTTLQQMTLITATTAYLLLSCCKERLLATHLPLSLRLAPLGALCQTPALQAWRRAMQTEGSLPYAGDFQALFLTAAAALMQHHLQPNALPLCQQLAIGIDTALLTIDEHTIWQQLLAYLAHYSHEADVRAIYYLKLIREYIACNEDVQASDALLVLVSQPLPPSCDESFTEVASLLFKRVFNEQHYKLAVALASLPQLLLPLTHLLKNDRQLATHPLLLPLCQSLMTIHPAMALEIAKTIGANYQLSPTSYPAWQQLVEQLAAVARNLRDSRLIKSTLALLQADQAASLLAAQLALKAVAVAMESGKYKDVRYFLQQAWQRYSTCQDRSLATEQALKIQLQACLMTTLHDLVSQKALHISQQILLDQHCLALLGATQWSTCAENWLKKASSSKGVDFAPVLVARLEVEVPLHSTCAVMCCKALTHLPASHPCLSTQLQIRLAKAAPRLITALDLSKAHRTAFCHLMLWIETSRAGLSLSIEASEKLLSYYQYNDSFASSTALQYLIDSKACEQVFEATASCTLYAQLMQRLWQQAEQREAAMSWLVYLQKLMSRYSLLPALLADEYLKIADLLQTAECFTVLWEWLACFRTALPDEQARKWQALAYSLLKAVIEVEVDELLAVQIAADTSFSMLSKEQLAALATHLPWLLQAAVSCKLENEWPQALIDNFASGLTASGWGDLWQILSQIEDAKLIEKSHALWLGCRYFPDHANAAVGDKAISYWLLALATVRSEAILSFLQSYKRLKLVFTHFKADREKLHTICHNLLKVSFSSAHVVPKKIIEKLYTYLLRLQSTPEQALAVSGMCLEMALPACKWQMVGLSLASHFDASQAAILHAQRAVIQLLITHVNAWATTITPCATAIIYALAHFPIQQWAASAAQLNLIYDWLCQLPHSTLFPLGERLLLALLPHCPAENIREYSHLTSAFHALIDIRSSNASKRTLQLDYLYALLKRLLEEATDPTKVLQGQVNAFYFHPYILDSVLSPKHYLYLQALQPILANIFTADGKWLAQLQLYTQQGRACPVDWTPNQLDDHCLALIAKLSDEYPALQTITIGLFDNATRYLNAFDTNFDGWYRCLGLLQKGASSPSLSPKDHLDSCNQLLSILITAPSLCIAKYNTLQLQQVRSLLSACFTALCHATVAGRDESYLDKALSYLNELTKAYLFGGDSHTPQEVLWKDYSMLIHACANLLIESLGKELATLYSLKGRLLNLYIVITKAAFSRSSTPQLADYRQQLYRQVVEILLNQTHGHRLAYILLQRAVEDRELFCDIKTLYLFMPRPFIDGLSPTIIGELAKATETSDKTAIEAALATLYRYPPCLQVLAVANAAITALICLYIECDIKGPLQQFFKDKLTASLHFKVEYPADTAMLTKVPLAALHWESNRRLATYLLVIDRLFDKYYLLLTHKKKALALARGLLEQLANSYRHEHHTMALAFCHVLIAPLTYCLELVEDHVKILCDDPKFARFNNEFLPANPKEQLYCQLFIKNGAVEECILTQYEQQQTLTHLVATMLRQPSWDALVLACAILRNYQTKIYREKDPDIIPVYKIIIDTCAHLLLEQPEFDGRELENLVITIYNGTLSQISGFIGLRLSSHLPCTPQAHALHYQLSDALICYMEKNLSAWGVEPFQTNRQQKLTSLLYAANGHAEAMLRYMVYCDTDFLKYINRLIPIALLLLQWADEDESKHLPSLLVFHKLITKRYTCPKVSKLRVDILNDWLLSCARINPTLSHMVHSNFVIHPMVKACYEGFAREYVEVKKNLLKMAPTYAKNLRNNQTRANLLNSSFGDTLVQNESNTDFSKMIIFKCMPLNSGH